VSRTDDEQAAYFALLRAREELAALQRYEEYLVAERARIDAFVAEGARIDAEVAPRLRRALRHVDEPLGEALELRRRVIADERRRMPSRLEAAQEYVDECETAHAAVRR
jgi:hypothetical protein